MLGWVSRDRRHVSHSAKCASCAVDSASLSFPIASSALLHIAVLGFILYRAATPAKALPPLYRVELIAAPAGPRAEGVVTNTPAPPVPTKAPPAPEKRTTTTKVAAKNAPKTKPTPAKAATPNITAKSTPQTTTAPPKAGGGEQGGAGTPGTETRFLR